MVDVREHVRDRSLLSFKLTELAILIAAREWTQNYVWNAHYPAAIRSGLDPEIIAAIADGRRPARMSGEEAILYDLRTVIDIRLPSASRRSPFSAASGARHTAR